MFHFLLLNPSILLPALEGIRGLAANMPPVLCLQNGVDNEPAIASVLGADKVIYGTVTSAVGRQAVGSIVLEKLRGMGVAAGHPLSEKLVCRFGCRTAQCTLVSQCGRYEMVEDAHQFGRQCLLRHPGYDSRGDFLAPWLVSRWRCACCKRRWLSCLHRELM